jgi:hypothetical protein
MSDINTPKTYVRPDDTAIITCPHCTRQKTVPVSSCKGSKSRIKVKCGCKNIFTVNLEFRKKIRKKTDLPGKFTNHSQKTRRGDIIVKNLSMDGLEFAKNDRDKFNIGDEIEVSFKLDNPDKTTIRKEAIVRNISKISARCEFVKSSQPAYESSLGFYLMP